VPLSRIISRVPAINRKSEFEPTRVNVRSENCNSARESFPVLRPVLPFTVSPFDWRNEDYSSDDLRGGLHHTDLRPMGMRAEMGETTPWQLCTLA
jgi:hypothetical protein